MALPVRLMSSYPAMRYVTAILGALFIFVAVFILSAFLVPMYPAFLQQWVSLGFMQTNNIVGLLLASLAATASFRATLRRYAKKKFPADEEKAG